MPQHDFDQVIPRRGSGSLKWDRYRQDDLLPVWVADMDFLPPPAVIEALHERVDHGVFGYGWALDADNAIVADYWQRRYGWSVEPSWVQWCTGLGFALHLVAQTIAQPGDSVLTLTPIYPPFLNNPKRAGFTVIDVPLTIADRRYIIDFDALEAAVRPDTRMFFLCNPHNPVGRCYTEAELRQLADFCLRHDLFVCADEVHADLLLEPDCRHIPFASLGPEIAARTITLHAPSKTYNLPGLGCAFLVIPDAGLRQAFAQARLGYGVDVPALGFAACRAALQHGEAWLTDLLDYLRANRDHARDRLAAEAPAIGQFSHEATYLSWLDCRELGVDDPYRHFLQAGVALSNGVDFAAPGFLRLNLGCPRALLDQALDRMIATLQGGPPPTTQGLSS